MPPVFLVLVPLLTTMGVGAAAAATISTGIMTSLISTGISMTINAVAAALKGGPGNSVQIRQPAAPWQIIYGQQRVNGNLVYATTSGSDKKYLEMIIVWAAHACQSIDDIYINGQKVYFQGGGSQGNAAGGNYTDENGNQYNYSGV
jgi:hypothetical protein